jgi:hypothetical protein
MVTRIRENQPITAAGGRQAARPKNEPETGDNTDPTSNLSDFVETARRPERSTRRNAQIGLVGTKPRWLLGSLLSVV